MKPASYGPFSSTRGPLLLALLASLLTLGLAQSPPRLLPEALEPRERVVPEGTNVQLSCPVEADPDTLFFEWYRDGEHLNLFADERYRVQGNGVLRVKNAVPEDTGLYMCRAVNGFGRADVNVTLIVLGSPESVVRVSPPDFEEDDEELVPGTSKSSDVEQKNKDTSQAPETGKPRLTQVSKFHGTVVQRLVGSSITFRCAAKANPRPQVSWLKNGKPLPDSNLPSASRRGHWSLYLKNLQASDTGNYTCHVYNRLGSVSATFSIKVIDRVRNKPEFVSTHPQNLTLSPGESAIFQCVFVSDIAPHVQWLKQIPEAKAISEDSQHAAVELLGEYYELLKTTEVIENRDGTFLNKLVVPSVRERDAGKYICLGANAMGYSFRSAFLTVLTKSLFPEMGRSSLVLPFPIVVGITVSGAILLSGLLGLILYCRSSRRLMPVPTAHVTTATNTTGTTTTATTTSSSSSGGSTRRVKNQMGERLYVGMAYHPHLDTSPARIYIPNGQLHRTVPLNSIFL